MARIELRNISHSYRIDRDHAGRRPATGDDLVLDAFDLSWEKGSANALLGPSGCGKTTILNLISGLLQPTWGRVLCDGRDVTTLDARARGVAQVFQFPVVYDSMSVVDNLAFPLRNQGLARRAARARAEEIADLLDLTPLLRRRAGSVSQADKQKVSLGRGIVRTGTAAILLDEPLTVIDPKEKYVLRRKIKQVQRHLGITMIYVTHDQHEALTFADTVTVLDHGRVVQTGSPADLHHEPASPFIGYFIGSPGMNLVPCRVDGDHLRLGAHRLPVADAMQRTLSPGELQLGIRPEFVSLDRSPRAHALPLDIHAIENMGTHRLLTVGDDSLRLKARARHDLDLPASGRVWATLPWHAIKLFDGDTRVH